MRLRKKKREKNYFGEEKTDLDQPHFEGDIKKVKKAVSKFGKQLSEVQKGENIREIKTADHAQQEANQILINTLNEIGLDAKSVAGKLKEAMDLAMTTGKVIKDPNDPHGRKRVVVPDLRAFKDLLFLWGNWMRVGRPSGIQKATFNLFGESGLDETQRQRVIGTLETIEAEIKRRGLPNVLQGSVEAENPETLSGMVESSEGEPETTD